CLLVPVEEPSGDDADEEDEEQDEDDDDEEDEHSTSADSIPPPPALRVMARISFRPQPLTLSFTKEDAERADRPEVTLPPRKRLSIVYCSRYEAGESSAAVAARPIEGRRTDYGFVGSVEEPEQAPPSLDYVPCLEHDDDEIVAEDQPYAKDASPTAQPHEYVPESDLEAHPEDDDDEDPEEDPVDYPADGEDDGDDEEGSSEDDEDDDMDIEVDEEEEEEHPATADSVVVASTAADQAPSADETEPFETDESAATPPPHLSYRMTARISIPAPVHMPAWSDSEVVRLLAMSSPPASPLSPWSSSPPQIPFLPLPPILSPSSPVLSPAPPPSPTRSLDYRAAMIRLQAEAASTSYSPPLPPPFILSPTRSDAPSSGTSLLLPISASTSSPSLQLPSASRREDRPEVTLPPRKKLGIALGPRYEVGESSSAAIARPAGGLRADYGFVATMDREIMHDSEREVGYGITDSWDEIVEALQGAPVSTDIELGGYMREFETKVRQDTKEIYMRLDDEQSERQLLAGRLNMLFRDRCAYAYTRHLMETEARMSREAWVRSTDASDLVRGALTWWNSHIRIVGTDAAYVMTWIESKKKMADKYCPRNEMKRLRLSYGTWKYKPPKRQDVARAYAAGSGNRQQYAGSRPLCPKCNFNHDGPCIPRCYNNNNNHGNQVRTRNAQARV
nr:hypothetical protein [Tanacetum cinerariifolium]